MGSLARARQTYSHNGNENVSVSAAFKEPLKGSCSFADLAAVIACGTVPTLPSAVAAKLETASPALGLVGTPRPSAHATTVSAPAPQKHPITTRFILRKIANFIITT